MHFYKRNDYTGEPESCHDIGVKKAKQIGAWPSVTSKAKCYSDGFLEQWSKNEAIKLAEVNPRIPGESDKDYCERISNLIFGEVNRHYDGKVFPSYEFGTAVHACLENHVIHGTPFPLEWEMYCKEWPIFLDNNRIETLSAETIVMDDDLKLAGTIDYIGYFNGQPMLADFKTRKCKDGKGKFYPKDCLQLAIESQMYMDENGLEELPMCLSVCIDVLTGTHYHKWYDEDQVLKGIRKFRAINECYNIMEGWI